MRILFISRVISPFQLELTTALRERGHDAHVLFSTGDAGTRPKHWCGETHTWSHSLDVESNPLRLIGFLERLRPDAIVYGGYRGFPLPLAKRIARSSGIPLGFWLEKPLPTTTFHRILRDVVVKGVLSGAAFVWPIGPEALRAYSPFVGDTSQLNVVPYGQNLAHNFLFKRQYPRTNDPIRFLFSGQFHHRNNIWELLSAFRSLRQRFGARAQLVLSGYAGMDAAVRRRIATDSVLSAAVSHDVEFDTWDDRLRPFKEADVLCMPGTHAGWGLIVPEAMSLGMPVIAGRGIESADMLLSSGHSGYSVDSSYFQIEEAMARYLARPELVAEHGLVSRDRARCCDADAVGQRMVGLLEAVLSK